mgnify:CR=1 FL=1
METSVESVTAEDMPDFFIFVLGCVIWIFREKRGVSQEHFANHIGLTQGMFSKMERGLSMPKLSFVVSAASVMGMSVSELFIEVEKLHAKLIVLPQETLNKLRASGPRGLYNILA